MGYIEQKKPIVDKLKELGYLEIPFNLDNDDTSQSMVDKGFTIKPIPPDNTSVMGGSNITNYGIELKISYVATNQEQYDKAYEDFSTLWDKMNKTYSAVETFSFNELAINEANYFVGIANFYIGSVTCQQ